jgi:hypothetical protein
VVGPIYTFEPDGLSFAKPVTVKFPVSDGTSTTELVAFSREKESTGFFQMSVASRDTISVTAVSMSFCDEGLEALSSATTLNDLIGSEWAWCSTDDVDGLSQQILAIYGTLPGVPSLAALSATGLPESNGRMVYQGYVIPLVQAALEADLQEALADPIAPSTPIVINSAFRTIAQQYLLKNQAEDCAKGGVVSTPGRSRHNDGRAIDIQDVDAWSAVLQAHGFGPPPHGDPVHFAATNGTAALTQSVLAFQMLWNQYHPCDQIKQPNEPMGVYDSATADRLGKSPVHGFTGPIVNPTPRFRLL